MILLILCLLAIFALIAVIFGRNTAQRGIFLALGITGMIILIFLQASLFAGLLTLAFLLPPIGIPLTLIVLFLVYVLPWLKENADTKRKIAVIDADTQEREKRLYFATGKAEELRQAVDRADEDLCITLCKQLSQGENWHLGIDALRSAFHSQDEAKRLCAVHGLRYLYNAETVQRRPMNTNASGGSEFFQHKLYYKPELLSSIIDLLSDRANDVKEYRRVRVAALIAIGNAALVGAANSTLALLSDNDEDIRAAAYHAIRKLMHPIPPVPTILWHSYDPPTPEQLAYGVAVALYKVHFADLLSALEDSRERLRLEAIGAACSVASLVQLPDPDLDGLIRVMQNIACDSKLSVQVHDAASKAADSLKTIQRSDWAQGGRRN